MLQVEPKRKSMPNKTCKVLTDLASLLSILKDIYQRANQTIRQMRPAQLFTAINTHHVPNLNTNTTHSNSQEREEIPPCLEEEKLEDSSIFLLCTYSTHPDWKQIVSTCNDHGQNLAHIAVTLGYTRLLRHLFKWKIDLNVVDSMGLSALHYAYLFKQEECAKFLIHSGVDRFILDDLGRSPADLDPSLEARLRSIMDIDSDNSADGAPHIEYDTEMPDEAEKLFAKHFLTQQWMGESEDERRGEMSLSRCQSQETSSPPALDSMGVPCGGSSSLVARTPEERSTPIVAEEIDSEALIETATSTCSIHPPSSISEVSLQTQESNSPSDTGQHPVSPVGGAITTPGPEDTQIYRGIIDFPHLARRELSVNGTTRQGRLLPVFYEPDITNLKARLIEEGAAQEDADLCDEIFKGGITIEALERPLTRSQCEKLGLRDGKGYQILLERYQILLEGTYRHRCRLCPRNYSRVFKNHRDFLRHLLKDHLGLSFECLIW